MLVDEFDYDLPEHLIAQKPLAKRTESRLLVLDRNNGAIEHRKFHEIIHFLTPNDVLVLNDTKVIPARLIGQKETTGAVIEVLMIEETATDKWRCLIKPARKISVGDEVRFSDKMSVKCLAKEADGIAVMQFFYEGDLLTNLDELGLMPLPPYIKEKLSEKDRYQTVYAKNVGSIAAPTAGLHFSEELLAKIKQKGVKVVYITLHVGIGTFRPVTVEDVTEHKMHAEFFSLRAEEAAILNQAQVAGNQIIAVGTTTTRTLESIYQKHNKFVADSGYTDLFIYPGYQFQAISALITNFHLPKSTLLMMICAFASKEYVFQAYHAAIKHEYRFFSFGDVMLIK